MVVEGFVRTASPSQVPTMSGLQGDTKKHRSALAHKKQCCIARFERMKSSMVVRDPAPPQMFLHKRAYSGRGNVCSKAKKDTPRQEREIGEREGIIRERFPQENAGQTVGLGRAAGCLH
jgi:hypothetical protein